MPTLGSPILLGIDFWAKVGHALPAPPPLSPLKDTPSTAATEGLTRRTAEDEQRLRQFLGNELPLFEDVTGPTDRTQHEIRLKPGALPIKQRYRPRNPAMQAVIDTEVEKMLQEGVIEPSSSPWSSPVVVVRKRDGAHRFCIDFRRVNEVTTPDAYPLPQITATLDKLRGAKYLTTLDLKSGYWQVPLAPASRPLTAFTVPGKGLFQFTVMPFGLHSAPATFQRLLDEVLGPELEPHVFVYLDDIIIINRTFDEHLDTLREVFRRLRAAKLRLNPDKCRFCVDQLKYLGHIVDQEGIRTDPEKVRAVAQWPAPRTVKQIRQFLGLASWYRRFIQDFATVAAPLTALTRKNARWHWGPDETNAFERIKSTLTTAPVLACPDFSRRFFLQTDASTTGLGAVLTQNFPEGERVIAYASRTLNTAEKNYSATELECLAVIWGIRRMRDYLEGYPFTVITDHQSLKWLQKLDAPTGRLGRWAFELQQFDIEIKYRKGALNRVADALSRQPVTAAANTPRKCGWYHRLLRAVQEAPQEYPDFEIRNGKLYRHVLHTLDFQETPAEGQWKECVAKDRRPEILRANHDEATAGHLGIAKTIARVARHYFWPGMFREVARYVRNCEVCLRHKVAQQRPAGTLHATAVHRPWEHVTLDLVGPLPRSTKGHTWLLNMQDRFTKWVEMRPLRRATAPAVTTAITEAIILRHGCPDVILSDNGTQLKSRQLEHRLAAYGIRHEFAPIHAPHCNPVERTNRTLKTMIAQYVGRNHRSWDEHLPELQFAYNSARHEATGYSPAYLNLGREPIAPANRAAARHGPAPPPDTTRRHLEEAYELVRISMARAFQHQQRHYDLRRRPWKPKVGEWVWKREYPLSNKANAHNAKLAPKFRGPLEVRRLVSPVIVDLRDKSGRWYRHIHVKDLKSAPDDDASASESEDSGPSESDIASIPDDESVSDDDDDTAEPEDEEED